MLPLLIGGAAIISAITMKGELAKLDGQGVEGKAVLVAKRYEEGASNGYQRVKTKGIYYVSYQFTPKGASQEISNERNVNRTFYDSVEVGEEFTLWYLARDVDVHELFEGEFSRQSGSSTVVGTVFFIFGLGLSFWSGSVAKRAIRARESLTEIVETYVTQRPWWPPLFNRMQYQLKNGANTTFHRTFIRPMWAYGSLKRGDKTRVALTGEGPYWAKDLFL